MPEPTARPAYPSLDTIGKLIPIVALLLPVSGAAFRVVSFAFSSTFVPTDIAAALPIGGLALAGFFALVRGVFLGLLPLPFIWFVSRLGWFPKSVAGRRAATVIAGGFGMGLFATTVTNLASASDAVNSIAAGLFTFALLLLFAWTGGKPSLFSLVAVVVAIVASNALIAGVLPNTAGTIVADVQFVPGGPVADGRYSILGEDDRTTWLLGCGASGLLVQIPSDSIRSLTALPFGGRPSPNSLGFNQRCP